MAKAREIVLSETKPATEWILGRAVQKVSPRRRHAVIQATFAGALDRWARESKVGTVGTEWEFRVTPPGEITRPLVPDIAFLSYGSMSLKEQRDQQIPYAAPDLAVEILSPEDRTRHVEEKIRVYLASGSRVVIIVEPKSTSLTVHDRSGIRQCHAADTFEHPALAGFKMRVADIFADP